MATTIQFKAGDTFSFSAEIPAAYLDVDRTWGARAWVRDTGANLTAPPKIDELVCTLTPPDVDDDPYVLLIFRDSDATGVWPRPASHRVKRKLIIDIELYDDNDPPFVISTSDLIVEIPFDATRS